ncbi:Pantothenate kinase [Fulvia fulva]|uniref:Pantothenate kinase n=1 Tax=Passalora fulva TaxID=5499 RepID=A0A9Q8PDE5_PASFU|nr:Pantothenate kinase [Fulvia fulva]KAK4619810.1 Pantothenate kinase [Fulvia fulva]KAK4620514.1 Pantothenate kinase [Fulvia fulva]UJO20386.1 Pantothenate kinase [Fulvia fulva]WPV17051.1 Pantothenate kinase [Fulvia fulva]WPV32058.1 Pantothenate kinase [Fulvia fulva]
MAEIVRPAMKKRRLSSSADMQQAIAQPGSIKINVTGAHIIDHEDGDSSPDRSPTSSQQEDEEHSFQHHKRDIRLPNHTAVVSHVAADIGGSLAKVVYFTRESTSQELGGRLSFLSFETDKIDACIEYLRTLQVKHQQTNGMDKATKLSIMATGGGAYKFYDRIKERLGVEVEREDEMECLIKGLDFFITQIPNEVFTYNDSDPDNAVEFQEPRSDVYPYLLVNIGSGVSMIKVSGPAQYQRIGGTSLGGGTLWGLLSLLTGARNFDDMLDMADKGDNSAVDLLVGDIYGEGMGYEKIGLSERTIASSFGKVLKRKREAERQAEDGTCSNGDTRTKFTPLTHDMDEAAGSGLVGDGRMFKPEDISRSLLYAISNNIGQIAYLQSEKHDLKRIYFGGSFIRGHQQTIHTLSFAIKFWSKATKQAFFLRHEGYLGAVGAFVKRKPPNWARAMSAEPGDE